MMINYNEFIQELHKKIKSGDDFYLDLLKTVIDNPSRYCGLFRLSNAKTKLIQNVTQSNEIKFGDFMEDIVTIYLDKMGYTNLPKDAGTDEDGNRLSVDQLFIKDNIIYLVEQKIRDDHDSTKKRGQFSNFDKKLRLIKRLYPNNQFIAIMWFIDNSLVKNKNYYKQQMENTHYENTTLNLYYGEEFFNSLENGQVVWNEIINHLMQLRLDNNNELVYIPDFANSDEMYNALINLPETYWRKLNSNTEKYEQLRRELFSNGTNLERAKRNR